ncbi:MAG TPA: 30S ribosomal protein S20 [Candidatus Paceibacterota bacterium]|nr:30S ribosomal protein S20 [Candidatus Paceibacterota bacterium]
MAITKSAKKALKKNLRNQERNRLMKNRIKKQKKEILKNIQSSNSEEARKQLDQYYKLIDKAVKNNLIKKNTGSRLKSQMAKKLN